DAHRAFCRPRWHGSAGPGISRRPPSPGNRGRRILSGSLDWMDAMLLAINANNTNVKFGLFEGERMVGDWRLRTDSGRTADEYLVWLSQLLALAGIDRRQIKESIIASVVPQALLHLRMLCEKHLATRPLIIGEPGVKLGIKVLLDRP